MPKAKKLPKERLAIAANACCEIEAIARLLQREKDGDSTEFDTLLGPLLRRIEALNNVVYCIVCNDDPLVDERQVVFGEASHA